MSFAGQQRRVILQRPGQFLLVSRPRRGRADRGGDNGGTGVRI
jgi:hypothetical protein